MNWCIAGIDLAWGERRPDGVCALAVNRRRARVQDIALTHGDRALLAWAATQVGDGAALLAIDAPIVCRNHSGARPVDRLTHVHYGRYKCGCHPANLGKCPRPPRVAAALARRGYRIGWQFEPHESRPRLAAEVYPHPAMVRLFDLPERIRYKRGPVDERRREFARLQHLLGACLVRDFPRLELDRATRALLRAPWTKDDEDRTDALVCALIGYWHWLHRGRRSEVLGDLATGFVLIPRRKSENR